MTVACTRVCLWSGPRNISTALMYSFAQRSDTRVVDEPLYAHYLARTEARNYHPGADEVLASMDNDGARVIRDLILGACDEPVIFFKHMTHHLVDIDWDFMESTTNVFLTRDPRDMLPSYVQQVERPTMRDVGYARHLELLEHLRALGQDPPVLDSRQTLGNPRRVLGRLCERLEIPFEEAMLSWNAGPRPEDGVWAKHWYSGVHTSTGFRPYTPRHDPFPDSLRELLEECLPLYDRLAAHAIPGDS